MMTKFGSGVGVTQALYVNFSLGAFSILQKYQFILELHSYLSGVTAVTSAKYEHDIQYTVTVFLSILNWGK